MLTDVKAVIFDLDGTLVDSMWMWKQIDIEYLSRYNITMPADLQKDIEGRSFSETAVFFKERFKLSQTIDEIKQAWNEMAFHKYMHEVSLKKGVVEFLEHCKAQGMKLGIATSNSSELAGTVIKARGIHEYFETLVTGCDVPKGKPAPDVYLLAAKQLQVKPSECLVFEDLIAGIIAGQAAGMKVCAINDSYSEHQLEEKKRLADYFIEDYIEVLN